MRHTYYYVAVWYATFLLKGFGITGLLSPRSFRHLVLLFWRMAFAASFEVVYLFMTRKLPANSQIAQRTEEFKNYQYEAKLQPWIVEA
jgi:hypothetical protein